MKRLHHKSIHKAKDHNQDHLSETKLLECDKQIYLTVIYGGLFPNNLFKIATMMHRTECHSEWLSTETLIKQIARIMPFHINIKLMIFKHIFWCHLPKMIRDKAVYQCNSHKPQHGIPTKIHKFISSLCQWFCVTVLVLYEYCPGSCSDFRNIPAMWVVWCTDVRSAMRTYWDIDSTIWADIRSRSTSWCRARCLPAFI